MSGLIASWLTPTSLFVLLNIMIGTIFLISRLSPPKSSHHGQQVGVQYNDYNSAPPPPPLQRAPSLLDRVRSINFSNYKFSSPNYNQDIDHHHQPDDYNSAAHPLERAPSILERVKSINFSLYNYKYSPQNPDTDHYIQPSTEHDYTNPPQQQPLSRAPSLLERVKSIDFKSFYRSDSFNKTNPPKESLETDDETDSETDMSPVHHDSPVKRCKSESKVKQRKMPEKMKKSTSERRMSEGNSNREVEEEEVERRRPATTRIEKTVSFGDEGVDAKADDFINKFKQQLKLQRLDSLLRYRDMLKGK
ncbi:hypothetical protein COLO4_18195 [Corchorus olitorius]|uniref:DUF4408 domain-containing protein n=1 Tax=Corchorus olitorius TaxID=93759 RepID=A0A1R3J9Z0_9ROSI|nr:hypothetical protein COLO4_18195 [Corchorus olitorius]